MVESVLWTALLILPTLVIYSAYFYIALMLAGLKVALLCKERETK